MREVFRIHGHYEIRREGDLIRVWSASEFNLEAARQYALDMMEMIGRMPPRFATLVEFESPPVIAPEVEESMHRSALERAACGMVAVAFVTENQDALAIARSQWERVYEGTGVAFHIFDQVDAARAWLQHAIDGKWGQIPYSGSPAGEPE